MGTTGFFIVPKGSDQIVFRTALVLSLVCMWLMWAVTYLAQINPLLPPERNWAHASSGSGGGGQH